MRLLDKTRLKAAAVTLCQKVNVLTCTYGLAFNTNIKQISFIYFVLKFNILIYLLSFTFLKSISNIAEQGFVILLNNQW